MLYLRTIAPSASDKRQFPIVFNTNAAERTASLEMDVNLPIGVSTQAFQEMMDEALSGEYVRTKFLQGKLIFNFISRKVTSLDVPPGIIIGFHSTLSVPAVRCTVTRGRKLLDPRTRVVTLLLDATTKEADALIASVSSKDSEDPSNE
uniref:Uncharacterized protein n=1 Tax=viral metagenome TaxID=1070528 RepID=A0A2V0RHJ3_9ZZZZ